MRRTSKESSASRLGPRGGQSAPSGAGAPPAAIVPAVETGGVLRVQILVQPRAARPRLGPVSGDRLKVAVTAPPVDGEANAAVIDLLANALGVSRRAVTICMGATGRRKTIAIEGASLARLAAAVKAS